ncbi:MAG: hypothetical protein GX242_06275 [Clostridiales bacterium]|nr:hypothetical protein [Clostridiales bacterium]
MEDKKGILQKKCSLPIVVSLAIILASLIAYLTVSFVKDAWSTSWLIWIGCAVAILIALTVFAMIYCIKKGKVVIPRISLAVSIAMVFTLAYLCLITLMEIDKVWIMYLIMPIAITGADTVLSYWIYAKHRIVSLIAFILVATALEYVILSLVELITWHPYWLIPLGGVIISALIVVLKLREAKKAKEGKAQDTEAEVEIQETEEAEDEVQEAKEAEVLQADAKEQE